VARAVAYVPDLLFGSNVVGMLQAGGHEPVLVSTGDQLAGALPGADVLIVDLTADPQARIALVKDAVPRSRMARAGAELVNELAREENAS
jgi:hypothetical protein